jgi:PAS domain S-box-containing protein
MPDAKLFRLMAEQVKDYAVFLLDPTGHIMSWSVGAQALKGYRADEILGKHFSVFYPPDTVARGWPQQELEMAGREGRFEDEGYRLRKDGSRFWANVVITALRDEQGRLLAFSHARPVPAALAGRAAQAERGALPPAGRRRHRLRHLHA